MVSGSTLTVAKGWFVTDARDLLVLEEPERQAKLVMVELAAATGDAAVTAAWSRAQPGFALPIAKRAELPARDGWDQVLVLVYAAPAAENRAVQALARRKGATWYVWLIDGKMAALERRAGEAATAYRSFKPAGLRQESFAGRTAHVLDAARLRLLTTFIEDTRKDADIPGAAIAIVQGGRVVYERGFGVKDRGGGAQDSTAAVSPTTLFLIGSTTKSLTTLLMARLIDRDVFAWTTPVTELLPTFALGDAEMKRKLTLQHTVCACTGLPRYDMQFLFEYAGVTPEDRVASMKTMVPTTGFGETFQYSNLMVAAGGFIAAHAAETRSDLRPARSTGTPGQGALGPAYDAAMAAEVFRPLGMAATTFDFSKAARANHATPHGQAQDLKYRPIPLAWEEGVLAVRPAGGAWSSVRDMSRYLQLELAKGVTPGGKRVVSEATLLHRREPQVKLSDQASYGLGLMMLDDHGVQVVQHGGNNIGFSSDMYFLPEHGVGVVMLTNAAGANAFLAAVRRRLLELLFDGKPQAAENLAAGLALVKAAQKEAAERIKPADEGWLASVVGEYTNPVLGKLSVRRTATSEAAVLDTGEWQSPVVKVVDLDASVGLMTTAPGMQLQFAVGPRTLTLRTPQQEYVFTAAGGAGR